MDVGSSHYGMGVEPHEIRKLTNAIYSGIRERTGKTDSDRVMKAWKKMLDAIADDFDEGLFAAIQKEQE